MTPKELLEYALAHKSWNHTVAVDDIREFMIESAREKPPVIGSRMPGDELKGVGGRPAYVKIQADDRIVMALNGPPELSPFVFLLVAVPTQAAAQAHSPIGDNAECEIEIRRVEDGKTWRRSQRAGANYMEMVCDAQ